MATHCPELIINAENSQTFTTFLQWFDHSVKNESSEIIVNSTSAVSELFVQLEKINPRRNKELNDAFVPII